MGLGIISIKNNSLGEKMKVFIINVVCGTGSTGHIVVDLYNAILATGNEACIAYGRGSAKEVQSYRIGTDIDVLIHAGLSRFTNRQGNYSMRATWALINKIESYSPDIIHVHNIHGYYINYKILFDFLRRYRKPVIWTMHDCWAFTGHCAYYEGVMCDGWLNGCNSCKSSYVYPKAYTSRKTSDNYERKEKAFIIPKLRIVTPSHWLQKQLSQSFFKNVPCRVINNGIDLDIFRIVESDVKERLGILGKKMILGVANVWTKFKGLDDFIALSEQTDSEYVVCMIGLSKKQLKALPDHIIGIERTESLEILVKYYSAADVFVNLTYEDTFPTVNIEALACGTPIITYRTGGSAEMIDETCGSCVEKGNIKRVLEEISVWTHRQCSAECRKRAMLYEKSECYEKYMSYYSEVMGTNPTN